MSYYERQSQRLPLLTPNLLTQFPDQTCDILNRLIRFYEEYRDFSYTEIQQNVKTITIENNVVNGIQTDLTNIHADLNNLAAVARSGDYNDLLNQPTIPTAQSLANTMYPVGAVYTNTSNVDPATILGGTWTSIGTQTVGTSTVYYYERTA